MGKKIFVQESHAERVKIDEFITIYNYFTKEDTKSASLVTAKLNGPHSMRINKKSEKIYLLIDGEADIIINKDKFHLKKGDAARVPANSWHSITGFKAFMAIIVSPPFDSVDEEIE